jgi:heme-degrading monooxygenase HmoA
MTPNEAAAKVIVLFRTTLRPGADLVAFEALDRRMSELVNQIPGYLGITCYKSADGDTISLAQFESHEALQAWRNHPEHLLAQRAGRERFYSAYDVRVCTVERKYEFTYSAPFEIKNTTG